MICGMMAELEELTSLNGNKIKKKIVQMPGILKSRHDGKKWSKEAVEEQGFADINWRIPKEETQPTGGVY